MFSNWRDCQEYKALGLPLSTTSNEACKLYDATLTQFVGWYDDEGMGGIENCVSRMLEADPNFVMGHVINNGLILGGTSRSIVLDPEFKHSIDTMGALADASSVNPREQLHAHAIKHWANGELKLACEVWEDILLDNPLDMLAIKLVQLGYYNLGLQAELRDSHARCLPAWKQTTPLYGYLLGMYAYALQETNYSIQAEKAARKALKLNPLDAWSTHVLCHVMANGRQKEAIQLLETTVQDWTKCQGITGHTYWHWALYNLELDDPQGALDIFDSKVAPRCNKYAAMIDRHDACSMLFRLEMEGVNVGDRWNDVFEVCRPHLDDHIEAFNDVHLMMGCLGANEKPSVEKMMNSLKDFARDGTGDNLRATRDIGLPICEALVAYKDGDYAKAVDLMYPIRYDTIKFGGTNNQRDVFNLFLIQSALKSSEKKHRKLARHLLMERKALNENSPMTDRLIARAMTSHVG